MPKRRTTTESIFMPVNQQEMERPRRSLRSKLAEHVGRLAVGTALMTSLFGLGGDSASHIDKAPEHQITHTVEDKVTVPVEGDARLALFVSDKDTFVTPLRFAPDFAAGPLNTSERQEIDTTMSQATDILRRDLSAKVTIRIDGESSDEAEIDAVDGDANLGTASAHNERLAMQRRDLAYEQAVAYVHGFEDRLTIEKGGAHEAVLSADDKAWVAGLAKDRHMTSGSFMTAYNHNRSVLGLSPQDSNRMATLIDVNRGVDMTMSVNDTGFQPESCDIVQQQIVTTHTETVNAGGGNDVTIIPGYIPPVGRLLRRRKKTYISDGYTYREATPKEVVKGTATEVYESARDRVERVVEKGRQQWNERPKDVFYYEERRQRRNKLLKRGAAVLGGVAALALIVPVRESVKVGEQPPVITETDCTTIETTPAYVEQTGWYLPNMQRLGRLLGQDFGNRLLKKETTVPASERVMVKEHRVYTFDRDGNLMGSESLIVPLSPSVVELQP